MGDIPVSKLVSDIRDGIPGTISGIYTNRSPFHQDMRFYRQTINEVVTVDEENRDILNRHPDYPFNINRIVEGRSRNVYIVASILVFSKGFLIRNP